jgi:hypothetical protein
VSALTVLHEIILERYDQHVHLAGKPLKAHLEQYVTTPEWKALTDNERRDYLAGTLRETRAAAREQLGTHINVS